MENQNKMSAAAAASTTKKKSRRRRKEEDESYRPGQLQKPQNQEKLTKEELQEEFVRNLTTFDSLKRKNNIIWDFKERSFIPGEDEGSYVTLFSMPSELVDPTDTDEVPLEEFGHGGELIDDISDKEEEETIKEEVVQVAGAVKKETIVFAKLVTSAVKPNGKEEEEPEPEFEEKEETVQSEGPKKLLNLFNFCERAAQTNVFKMREHSVQTENPTRSHYRDGCNQWIIYDAYKADAVNRPSEKDAGKEFEQPDQEHEHDAEHGPVAAAAPVKEHHAAKKEDPKLPEKPKVKIRKSSYLTEQAGGGDQAIMLKAVDGLRFMERLVGSNVFEDVLEDFKYYEDGADEYREPSELLFGTLLPLWKFNYEKAKKMHVTGINWSESQPDMFAVTYGSFNFTHPVRTGLVVIFSLRNTTYPEFVWTAPNGAMSCDIHFSRNCLVAVGLYDGNVAVLNLEKDQENQSKTEILRNVPSVLKHGGPIWSVKWGQDDIDGNPSFYSAGTDGKFIHWVVGLLDTQKAGGLDGTELATFYLPANSVPGPDGIRYKLFGCGRVMAFHPKEKSMFIVGTAEGKIMKCSVNYPSKFQRVFDAHFLPVAALMWNHYHHDIFISSSEDWTIKIWDQTCESPMYVFEVGIGILDVSWAPYSSTIFAASTDDGKVLVYDLSINKERPICSQQVVAKKKVHPHRIEFNPIYPILIVGDDKSGLLTLKLSPNLRTLPKDPRNIFYLEGEVRIKHEINKLKKLLSLVRDPDSLQGRQRKSEN